MGSKMLTMIENDREKARLWLAEAILYGEYLYSGGSPEQPPPFHSFSPKLQERGLRHADAVLALFAEEVGDGDEGAGPIEPC
jgi:hypothetical protein